MLSNFKGTGMILIWLFRYIDRYLFWGYTYTRLYLVR